MRTSGVCITNMIFALFSSLIIWPPISTLFPYTTLFRSRLLPDGARVEDEHVGLVLGGRLAEPELLEQPLDADRKSTRLNSSHVEISYAVFCLKKKKKKKKQSPTTQTIYSQPTIRRSNTY